MRSMLTAVIVAAGLVGFGAATQAAPVTSANPAGIEAPQILQEAAMKRHRMKRHRMMKRKMMKRRMMKRRM